MAKYLHFHFHLNDPETKVQEVIVPTPENNFISHSFIQTPIYDNDTDIRIGYKVSDDYVQKLSDNLYSVRINSTYHFLSGGSISWQYAFLNNKPTFYYPLNVPNASNIISGTGPYLGKSGIVSLIALENGRRNVTIGFNFF
jgi:hypothetical protein